MDVEFDKNKNRERYRFNVEEVQKYAGKDVPHTVIKTWINHGKNLQNTLQKVEEIVNESQNKSALRSIDDRLKTVEKAVINLSQSHELYLYFDLQVARLTVLSASANAASFSSLSSENQELLRSQDEAFKKIASTLIPEIELDYFISNLTKRGGK